MGGATVCQWCCTNRTHGGHHCSLSVCSRGSWVSQMKSTEVDQGLFTDSYCKVCSAQLISESQRVAHYESFAMTPNYHVQLPLQLYVGGQFKQRPEGASRNNRCAVGAAKCKQAKRANPEAKDRDLPQRAETVYWCKWYGVYLCIASGNHNCLEAYHSEVQKKKIRHRHNFRNGGSKAKAAA
ncbi:hypothetical protein NFI96_000678 [Prochilodus magdalenae]|nr:hypothetical protein NFI96_000678 [Prochilodus magdalenae]